LYDYEIKNMTNNIQINTYEELINYIIKNIKKYQIICEGIFENEVWNIFNCTTSTKYNLKKNEIIIDNSVLYKNYFYAKNFMTLFANFLNKQICSKSLQNNENIKIGTNIIKDSYNKICWCIIYINYNFSVLPNLINN